MTHVLDGEDVSHARIGKAVEEAYHGTEPPEAARMLLAIGRDEPLAPAMGWFGPGRATRSWGWLAEREGVSPHGSIRAEAFAGKPDWFRTLDRDGDGAVTGRDLEWSAAKAPDASEGETVKDPRLDLVPGEIARDESQKEVLLRAYFAGELGSLGEGPPVGGKAPDFTLSAEDGSGPVRLYDRLGSKPVVLLFGSLTCDRFRDEYGQVEAMFGRYRGEATFLFVYVREAHPADGWTMPENEWDGIVVRQPKTLEERAGVAKQCRAMLKPSMPLLIDGAGDATAEAYAAAPARIYVIDPDGTVAYKSGRAPFGFKPAEAEQALVLSLIGNDPSAERRSHSGTPAL